MAGKKTEAAESAAEWADIGSLVPWDRNPRINDHAVDRVARSIIELGWGDVIVARREDRMVISGHTRLKGALRLPALWAAEKDEDRARWSADAKRIAGGDMRVPVRLVDVSRAVAEKLALAANKLGELAAWDERELASLIAAYDDPRDAQLLGFGDNEIEALMKLTSDAWATDGAANVDEIPDYDPADETFVLKIEKITAADRDRVLQVVNDVLSNAGFKYVAKAF
jgi:site-specific DNA-methyltransferase (adenine-specific)